jgi:hypothetical protein
MNEQERYSATLTDLIIELQPPKFELRFAPDSDFVIFTAKAPNRFHRIMQRLFFGFVWSDIK